MSRICLIAVRNLSYITTLPKYIAAAGEKIDIIYWNKYGLNESCDAANLYVYARVLMDNCSRTEKIHAYLGFRHFALRILKKNKYGKIIVLPTQTAVALADYLISHHGECEYLLDIRDYTAENKEWFKPIMNALVRNAAVASLTSPAYTSFLPKREYLISHNYTPMSENEIIVYRNRERRASPVTVSCIGGIRFIESFSKIIRIFANDPRFVLRFDGGGSEKLEPICKESGINNVILTGRFKREDTIVFNMKADIANNLFGNHTPLLDYALSNRLYNAAQLGMPILACPDTYTAQIACEYGFGFVFDIGDPACKDKLFTWYQTLDRDKLYAGCDRFLNKVRQDEVVYLDKISEFFNAEGD